MGEMLVRLATHGITLLQLVDYLREVGPHDQLPSPIASEEDIPPPPPPPNDEASKGEAIDEEGNPVANGSNSTEEEDPSGSGRTNQGGGPK